MPTLNVSNVPLLSSFFTSTFVNKIINNTHVQYINEVLNQTGFIHSKKGTVQTFLGRVFMYLSNNYRCEYVYKVAVLNEISKIHSLERSEYLTEFRVFDSKADILFLNGTSAVYEIKSDVDNLTRLQTQINAYRKIFDQVFIVTNPKNINSVYKIVEKSIGLLQMTEDTNIETIRDSKSHLKFLDKACMFDSLRKPEYLEIIKRAFGIDPTLPNTLIHQYCKNLFVSLPNEQAHGYFLEILKYRNANLAQKTLLNSSKAWLRPLLTQKKYSLKECELIKFGLTRQLLN